MTATTEPVWPVDLGETRLWPMEGEDGPLLQELFDDLADFRAPFGERGSADAVATFLALPEDLGYESKLLVGVWRDGGLAGALDCIMGYPTAAEWTIGLLVVADRYRRLGLAGAVVDWLSRTAFEHSATRLRAVLRQTNLDGLAFAAARGFRPEAGSGAGPDLVVVARSTRETAGPEKA